MKGAIHQEEKTIINKHWHNQFQWTNTTKLTSTDRHQHSNIGRLPYPTLIKRQVNQTKDQQWNFRIHWHYRPNSLNRHLQNIYPVITQYTFFSVANGNFFKIDYNLGHKASLNKYFKSEITPCILSDHMK
jgi:hypothetical protein